MNSITNLSDSELLIQTESIAITERQLHADLIRHLREVERRRLYLGMGYPSLYLFCTKHLKLSEGATFRRISSMRLIRDLPDQEQTLKDLESGQVNLNTLSATHRFIRQEAKQFGKEISPEDRQKLVKEIQNRSQRDCEMLFASLSPQAIPSERARALTPIHTEIKFVLTAELKAKLETLRAHYSHRLGEPSYAELFSLMADLLLKKIRPSAEAGSVSKAGSVSEAGSAGVSVIGTGTVAGINTEVISEPKKVIGLKTLPHSDQMLAATDGQSSGSLSFLLNSARDCPDQRGPSTSAAMAGVQHRSRRGSFKANSRYIPAAVRREVWARDGGACQYVDRQSGRQCRARFRVQLDHIQPFAKGGPSTADNLRCACRAHNQWLAEQAYGRRKMSESRTRNPRPAKRAGSRPRAQPTPKSFQ